MADNGVTPEGFNTRRFDEIRAAMEEAVRTALGAEAAVYPDSVEGQLVTSFSLVYESLWEQLKQCYDAFNPNAVTAQGLDNLVLLNGLFRLQARPSIAILTCSGITNTVIPAGSQISSSVTGDVFITQSSATIDASGSVDVQANASVTGRTIADADTLTIIDTPVNGWASVTNPSAAIVGRDLETDAELRVRRSRSLALAGNSSYDAVFARVGQVDGVSYVSLTENDTDDTSLEGVPPHSFIVVVEGGANIDIAQAIWNTKPLGVATHGNITVETPDAQLDLHDIKFSRPVLVPIYLQTNITFLSGSVPGDAVQTIKDAIIAWANGTLIEGRGFGVGEDVIVSQLYQPINFTYDDILINTLEVSLTGTGGWVTTSIAINFDELSSWVDANLSVTVG